MAMTRKRRGMKLDQALKLYIALYCLCFLLTWLVSVPMLIHVTPQSECLLFVTPYVKYGPAAGKSCHFFGNTLYFDYLPPSLHFCWICAHLSGSGNHSADCAACHATQVFEGLFEETRTT